MNSVPLAVSVVLQLLYPQSLSPNQFISTEERNNIIRARFAAGETLEVLAQEFGISVQRVHQIVHRRHH